MSVSLPAQIGELSRTIEQTEREFGAAVGRGKMRAAEAEYRLDCLRAAMTTLLWLQQHETEIKTAIKGGEQA